ncbi:MAG: hypothetical protein ACPKM0_00860 [Pleomorphochaeta sp.]
MKKFSALLLTGIIGTSMLFADFSGTATFSHTLADFDTANLDFGMANTNEFDATISLFSESSSSVGEGDVYAGVDASLDLYLLEESGDDVDEETTTDSDNTVTTDLGYFDLDLDVDAYVKGEGWCLNISGVADPVDYAADITALDDDDDAYNYAVAGNTLAGVTLTLDEYGTFSLGIENGELKDLAQTDVYVAAETNSLELAEGVTAQVGASALIDTALTRSMEAGASAMVDYAMDDLTVSFAIDAGYDALVGFGWDSFVAVAADALTVDAYYGPLNTNADFDFDDTSLDGLENKVYDADADGDDTTNSDDDLYSIDNLLNVNASYDMASMDVPVSIDLTALDLVNTQDIDVQINYALSDELAPYVTAGFDIDAKDWCAGAGATYTTDMYTADASFSISDAGVVSAAASVESTTLVDNATLTLAWEDGDDLFNIDGSAGSAWGSLTAYCEIDF